MFATISVPFFSTVSMTTAWHARRLWKKEGDKPCLFHCAKMLSLLSTAILSLPNTSRHNKMPLVSLLRDFSAVTRHLPKQILFCFKKMRYRLSQYRRHFCVWCAPHVMCWVMFSVSYWWLTIAITAAPAPARAQMNRWNVMSSCTKTNHSTY